MNKKFDVATLGGGCFWGMEELFRQIRGVKETKVGYMGGVTEKPTYQDVCLGVTGHVEVVQIKFDSQETSYDKLLAVFWRAHYPTQSEGQGNDIGSQYRPVIFCHSPEQRVIAEQSKNEIQKQFNQPIATAIELASSFWLAEEYHQKYLLKNPDGYCHISVQTILQHVQS